MSQVNLALGLRASLLFIKQIVEGIDDTGVKARIIRVASDRGVVTEIEETVLHAAVSSPATPPARASAPTLDRPTAWLRCRSASSRRSASISTRVHG